MSRAGVVLVVIGWILILIALIYTGVTKNVDWVFYTLNIVGLALQLFAVIMFLFSGRRNKKQLYEKPAEHGSGCM